MRPKIPAPEHIPGKGPPLADALAALQHQQDAGKDQPTQMHDETASRAANFLAHGPGDGGLNADCDPTNEAD
jgi:hypothetical protein